MTITVSISANCHVVIGGIDYYFLLLHIFYYLYLQQAPQPIVGFCLFVCFFLMNCPKPFLKGLGHYSHDWIGLL